MDKELKNTVSDMTDTCVNRNSRKMVRYLTISGYLTNEQIRVVDPDSFERGFLVVSSCNYIYQI